MTATLGELFPRKLTETELRAEFRHWQRQSLAGYAPTSMLALHGSPRVRALIDEVQEIALREGKGVTRAEVEAAIWDTFKRYMAPSGATMPDERPAWS